MSYSGHIIRVELWHQEEDGTRTLEKRADGILEEIGENANRNFEDIIRWGQLFLVQSSKPTAKTEVGT